MSVPERLALIGGSILLATFLVFSLKDYAGQWLPRVFKNISSVFDSINQNSAGSGAAKSSGK